MYKKFVFFLLMGISFGIFAEDNKAAVPTLIKSVNNLGFIIHGSFGMHCSEGSYDDRVFIPKTHEDYNQLYSMALAAFMGGKTIYISVNHCETIPFISGTREYSSITGEHTYFTIKH